MILFIHNNYLRPAFIIIGTTSSDSSLVRQAAAVKLASSFPPLHVALTTIGPNHQTTEPDMHSGIHSSFGNFILVFDWNLDLNYYSRDRHGDFPRYLKHRKNDRVLLFLVAEVVSNQRIAEAKTSRGGYDKVQKR